MSQPTIEQLEAKWDNYANAWHLIEQETLATLILMCNAVDISRAESIIEIGCSTGAGSQYLCERVPQASLIITDLSAVSLKIQSY